MIQELLTEKLRPKEIKHMILPQRIKSVFKDETSIHNFLFAGPPGCGKTTLAKILASKFPHKFINVSDQSSVETVRNEINDFCMTMSVMGEQNSFKIVILDEFDGASDQFYKALRGTIEKFSKNTRFLATCNYLEKVPEAIRSRFELINFESSNSVETDEIRAEWTKRVGLIVGKLGIEIDERSLSIFADQYFPDMRSALNKIQAWDMEGVTQIDEERLNRRTWDFDELYKLIFTGNMDPVKNYQFIVGNYSNQVDDVMLSMGSEFPKWVIENEPKWTKIIPASIILVAQHQAQRNQVIDPVVSLLSLVYSIQKMIS
jgi:DNA polymerase III delta prime subunit